MSAMDTRLDMSLDDVIKQNAKQTAGRGAAKGAKNNSNKGKRGDQAGSARREQSRARSLATKQGGVSSKRKIPLVLDHNRPQRQTQQRNGQARSQQAVTLRRGPGQRRGPSTGPVNLQVTITNQQARAPARTLPMPMGYVVNSTAQASQPAYGRQTSQPAFGRQPSQPAYGGQTAQPVYARQAVRGPAVQQVNAMVQQGQQPTMAMYGTSAPAAASYLRDDAQRGDVYTADTYNNAAAGMRMDQYQAAFARARGQQVYAGQ